MYLRVAAANAGMVELDKDSLWTETFTYWQSLEVMAHLGLELKSSGIMAEDFICPLWTNLNQFFQILEILDLNHS